MTINPIREFLENYFRALSLGPYTGKHENYAGSRTQSKPPERPDEYEVLLVEIRDDEPYLGSSNKEFPAQHPEDLMRRWLLLDRID